MSGDSQVEGRIGLHLASVCPLHVKDFVSVNIKHGIKLLRDSHEDGRKRI